MDYRETYQKILEEYREVFERLDLQVEKRQKQ